MPLRDNLYSRFVTWLKILLPMAALALLATLFLFPRGTPPESVIPYAEIQEIARAPRVSDPEFAGIASDGSVFTVNARTMRPIPDREAAFTIDTLRVQVVAPDGSRINMTSGAGEVDTAARIAWLTGLTRVIASGGYVMETAGLHADMGSGEIRSLGPLEVQAPYGNLTAGSLLVEIPEGAEGQVMVFNDGVRLIYLPGQAPGKAGAGAGDGGAP